MNTKEILEKVKSGELTPDEAALQLKLEPFEDMGFAKIDHHRALRQGSAGGAGVVVVMPAEQQHPLPRLVPDHPLVLRGQVHQLPHLVVLAEHRVGHGRLPQFLCGRRRGATAHKAYQGRGRKGQ